MLKVVVTRRAASEILEAAEWWRENRPATPELSRTEIARSFQLVAVRHSCALAHESRFCSEPVRPANKCMERSHMNTVASSSGSGPAAHSRATLGRLAADGFPATRGARPDTGRPGSGCTSRTRDIKQARGLFKKRFCYNSRS